jgi:hypothetical protein
MVSPTSCSVGTLGSDAGKTRQRFGDAGIRQLADVLGGDRLHNVAGLTLDLDRGLDARADAGDGDFLERLVGGSHQYGQRSDEAGGGEQRCYPAGRSWTQSGYAPVYPRPPNDMGPIRFIHLFTPQSSQFMHPLPRDSCAISAFISQSTFGNSFVTVYCNPLPCKGGCIRIHCARSQGHKMLMAVRFPDLMPQQRSYVRYVGSTLR